MEEVDRNRMGLLGQGRQDINKTQDESPILSRQEENDQHSGAVMVALLPLKDGISRLGQSRLLEFVIGTITATLKSAFRDNHGDSKCRFSWEILRQFGNLFLFARYLGKFTPLCQIARVSSVVTAGPFSVNRKTQPACDDAGRSFLAKHFKPGHEVCTVGREDRPSVDVQPSEFWPMIDRHPPDEPLLSKPEQRVFRTFRTYLMTPGKMLCFSGPDLLRDRPALDMMTTKKYLVKEKFVGGYSLTDTGFAMMKDSENHAESAS